MNGLSRLQLGSYSIIFKGIRSSKMTEAQPKVSFDIAWEWFRSRRIILSTSWECCECLHFLPIQWLPIWCLSLITYVLSMGRKIRWTVVFFLCGLQINRSKKIDISDQSSRWVIGWENSVIRIVFLTQTFALCAFGCKDNQLSNFFLRCNIETFHVHFFRWYTAIFSER